MLEDDAFLDHSASEWPAWGTLPLDWFMIDNWEAETSVTDEEQRANLISRFATAGSKVRVRYAERTAEDTEVPTPTEDQISNILQPSRSTVLRHVAQQLNEYSGPMDFVWLRTDYDHEEQHQAFVDSIDLPEVEFYEHLSYEGKILADRRYYDFGINQWQQVFSCLPEILRTKSAYDVLSLHDRRRELLARMIGMPDDPRPATRPSRQFEPGSLPARRRALLDEEEPDDGELQAVISEYYHRYLEPDNELLQNVVSRYHHRYASRFLLVEDAETFTTEPNRFDAMWLDDRGNVIRNNRLTAQDVCYYISIVGEGMGPEDYTFMEATVGPKYAPGGEYAPPFVHAVTSNN
ncbi:hypothetical protein B0A50_03615 [Salinomyces thailandicus]|uniref:Uncharacterized protein n=1 Tax=Salinomyces thailandicus TaxID=706561 RepID=A0A4U0U3H8_9PEZI|nr:hypothetical protein B0A50_03615 [Salinomyces thailandica]